MGLYKLLKYKSQLGILILFLLLISGIFLIKSFQNIIQNKETELEKVLEEQVNVCVNTLNAANSEFRNAINFVSHNKDLPKLLENSDKNEETVRLLIQFANGFPTLIESIEIYNSKHIRHFNLNDEDYFEFAPLKENELHFPIEPETKLSANNEYILYQPIHLYKGEINSCLRLKLNLIEYYKKLISNLKSNPRINYWLVDHKNYILENDQNLINPDLEDLLKMIKSSDIHFAKTIEHNHKLSKKRNLITAYRAFRFFDQTFVFGYSQDWILQTEPIRANTLSIIFLSLFQIGLVVFFFSIQMKQSNIIKADLEESNEFSRIVLDNIQLGILIISMKRCKILDYNQNAKSILHAADDDFKNKAITDILQIDIGTICKQLEESKTFRFETERENHNNSIQILNIQGVKSRFQHEDCVILSFTDISNQRQNIYELMKAKKRADEANKNRADFITNLSHQFKTPINSIIGLTQMLQRTSTDKKHSEAHSLIKGSAKRLLEMINDILDISRSERGDIHVNITPFKIEQITNPLQSFAEQNLKDKNVDFVIHEVTKLNKNYFGDLKKINQILNNLISNAIKYTEQGKISLRIHKINNVMYFELSDTGLGMSPEALEQILSNQKPLEKAFSSKIHGTGLGLNICFKLVKVLEGEMSIESKPKEGTTAWFYIPVHETNIIGEEIDIN